MQIDSNLKVSLKNYRTLTVMGIDRIESRLKKYFGNYLSQGVVSVINLIAINFPLSLMPLVPKSICSLFGSSALILNLDKQRTFTWADRAAQSSYEGHQKASFFIKMNYAFKNFNTEDFKHFIEDEVLIYPLSHIKQEFYKVWLFHNASHSLFSNNLTSRINILIKTDNFDSNNSPRFLPEHTTNMGHLGFLFLYANYYRKIDPQREIIIWPDLSPNKLYLSNLLDVFPLRYKLFKGKPNISGMKFNDIDTLTLSRIKPGNWRYETGSCLPCNQDFPEYEIQPEFKLPNNIELTEVEQKKLFTLGFDSKRWFVALHIKEHLAGYLHGGETRDCSILDFRRACKLINKLGGQVVRMGSANFPKLNSNFPAIDYAHSQVRSEKLDYWLWANCKYWIGNGNGASIAIIPFDKPRLVTNVWPLNPHGPINDFYLPKLVYSKNLNRLLSPKEILNLKFSRSMKKQNFNNNEWILLDNPEELIEVATMELHNFVTNPLKRSEEPNSNFDQQFIDSMGLSQSKSLMRLPKCFDEFFHLF